MSNIIKEAVKKCNDDPSRLMDILLEIHKHKGFVDKEDIKLIAQLCKCSVVDVEQAVSFYHFFSTQPRGKYTVYLNNSVTSEMHGKDKIAKAFEKEVGCKFGSVSSDGLIGLFETSCIGMNDQEPAAIINAIVFPSLTEEKVKIIVQTIKEGKKLEKINFESGEGKNNSEFLKTFIKNNIRKRDKVILSEYTLGEGIKKLSTLSPEQLIDLIKKSNLRGRGGAGFPTGLKWEFCRKSSGDKKYVLCNADEGEPGTFKDRVILTEYPELVFEGMTIAGYAIGSNEGILYLRFEYQYLRDYLEKVLEKMRKNNLLGENIGGIKGFNFDIRIQLGAGAYVCGEETALIESAEGKRGEPRDRPPFPVNCGYLKKPSIINNVETLCAAVKIVSKGEEWFRKMGTPQSTGTKVLSISGDCKSPGIYEVEWGITVNEILSMVGVDKVQAVLVGGPSGTFIAPDQFNRKIAFEDLPTGGSFIIFNDSRNIIRDIVTNFLNFFIEESCGSCAPCRFMPVVIKEVIEKILSGKGTEKDLKNLESWCSIMPANRCGLGQTSTNAVKTTLKNLPHLYKELVKSDVDFISQFDFEEAITECCNVTDRKPVLHGE